MFLSGIQFALGLVVGLIGLVLSVGVFFGAFVLGANAVESFKQRAANNPGRMIGFSVGGLLALYVVLGHFK